MSVWDVYLTEGEEYPRHSSEVEGMENHTMNNDWRPGDLLRVTHRKEGLVCMMRVLRMETPSFAETEILPD